MLLMADCMVVKVAPPGHTCTVLAGNASARCLDSAKIAADALAKACTLADKADVRVRIRMV